ncbi:MAG: sulfatase-like hydrolase/transferase [Deltaproteobacteria bacterium]|nr:sulfatase-like hydrolase/transferase [Deltaproteobacteria bacterium]
MAPSRMFKAFTSEGGIKTPMLVKLPGKMAHADTLNHSFFHVRDIMPTILDLVKIVSPEKFKDREVRCKANLCLTYLQGSQNLPMRKLIR